jgi:hypothetical protein
MEPRLQSIHHCDVLVWREVLQMVDCELGSQFLECLGDHISVALGVVALEADEACWIVAEAVGEVSKSGS